MHVYLQVTAWDRTWFTRSRQRQPSLLLLAQKLPSSTDTATSLLSTRPYAISAPSSLTNLDYSSLPPTPASSSPRLRLRMQSVRMLSYPLQHPIVHVATGVMKLKKEGNDEFIERRLAGLDRFVRHVNQGHHLFTHINSFLKRCAAHPVLRNDPVLRSFLESAGKVLYRIMCTHSLTVHSSPQPKRPS